MQAADAWVGDGSSYSKDETGNRGDEEEGCDNETGCADRAWGAWMTPVERPV